GMCVPTTDLGTGTDCTVRFLKGKTRQVDRWSLFYFRSRYIVGWGHGKTITGKVWAVLETRESLLGNLTFLVAIFFVLRLIGNSTIVAIGFGGVRNLSYASGSTQSVSVTTCAPIPR